VVRIREELFERECGEGGFVGWGYEREEGVEGGCWEGVGGVEADADDEVVGS
jgi:hypothetical protein